jgi:hypothetical protein
MDWPRQTLLRGDFERLADSRLREAQMLAQAGGYDGAVYLAGYTIECALKARIARQTQAEEFPDLKKVQASYVHDLNALVGVAGLGAELDSTADAVLLRDWALVSQWKEDDRYRTGASEIEARDRLIATERVLARIRAHS